MDTQILTVASPLMTSAAWAAATGLPLGVVEAQMDRGYWPLVHVGRRRMINAEAVRLAAAERAREFAL